jgi:tRNA (guanine-N7-)-methyltransferase
MFEEYRYLINPAEFEKYPVNWAEVFGNDQPIEVEIGFGYGEFLNETAKRKKTRNFIGIEMSIFSAAKAQRKFYVSGLENIRLIIVDARFALRNLFFANTVEKVYLNFPCPWSKKKHAERRVIVPEFFATLNNILTKEGVFELSTDVEAYAKEAKELGLSMGYLPVISVKNPDREAMTRFERKWKRFDRDIYFLQLKKTHDESVERLMEGPIPMPHRIIPKEDIQLEVLPELIEKIYKSEDEKQICVYKSIYKNLQWEHYVIKAITTDETFVQHCLLVLVYRGNDWVVKLDSSTNPYRTPAIKFAVAQLANLLTRKNPPIS